MADRLKVWYDGEADFLEVRFSNEAGYERRTDHDAVTERVNEDGKVIGFSVLGATKFGAENPLTAVIAGA